MTKCESKNYNRKHGKKSKQQPENIQALKAAKKRFDQIFAGSNQRTDCQCRGENYPYCHIGRECAAFL